MTCLLAIDCSTEAMCLALMIDAEGDREMLAAQERMRATLERWIPIVLAAQEQRFGLLVGGLLPGGLRAARRDQVELRRHGERRARDDAELVGRLEHGRVAVGRLVEQQDPIALDEVGATVQRDGGDGTLSFEVSLDPDPELVSLVPTRRTRGYDMRRVVARICDPGMPMTFMPPSWSAAWLDQ